MHTIDTDRRAAIRRLNDRFRCHGMGSGSLLVTCGIEAKGPAFLLGALEAMRTFAAFDTDNDPHGEHDFGAFTHGGERLFFKLDYYTIDLDGGSPDPADEAVTKRVLTLMLASEY